MQELTSFLGGRWQPLQPGGAVLRDPVTGESLAQVDGAVPDLAAAFAHARERGGPALRALGASGRGALLARLAGTMQAQRDKYYDIALRNSGTVKNDSAIDIDGALYTLSYYAKLAASLPEGRLRADGDAVPLARDNAFASRHVLAPVRGVALLINAFNFPAWGLWEKAAPALLSGVPVVVKPATATAWLAHEMIRDVAALLPTGAISLVCGSSAGLLDALEPLDLLSFTGSADTAALLRAHPRLARDGVRLNAETDSVNSAILGPDAQPGSPAFESLVREVVREITIKSGQKCTAIRRVMVPEALYDDVAQAVATKLAGITVGNPRNESVRMGSLVSRAQFDAVRTGLGQLRAHCDVLFDGSTVLLVDADPEVSACAAPWLLGTRDPDGNTDVHSIEVFGPVATLMPYRDPAHAWELARRGQGSLVMSAYSDDSDFLARTAAELADSHGRVHLVSPEAAKVHTGHGNVMPQSIHGGPGRAGGGEELGGLRALAFYHRRCAVQGAPGRLQALDAA